MIRGANLTHYTLTIAFHKLYWPHKNIYTCTIHKEISMVKNFRVKLSLRVIFEGQSIPTESLPQKLATMNNRHHKLGDMVTEHEKKLSVRGCHVYQDIWGKQQLQPALQLYKHYFA